MLWFFDGSNLHSLAGHSINVETVDRWIELIVPTEGATHALCAWDAMSGVITLFSGTEAECEKVFAGLRDMLRQGVTWIEKDDLADLLTGLEVL